MAGHYINTVEDQVTGKPVNGATILVYNDGAAVTGDSVTSGTLATIFSDDGATQIDQSALPVTTGPDGEFDFYTDETRVTIAVLVNGVGKAVWNDVDILGGTVSSDVTALAVRVSATESIIGLASPSADLGTFTGTTITDNTDVVTALQELETAVESSGGDLLAANNLSDVASASTSRDNLALEASTAAFHDNTVTNQFLSPRRMYAVAELVTLADAANIALDLDTGLNFDVTLAGSRTLDNPTNAKEGQSGVIRVTQDATGSRTLAFGTKYLFAGGAATLSTDANAVDIIAYYVDDNLDLLCTLSTGFAAT